MSDETTATPERKHIVMTAGYWFAGARKAQREGRMAEAVSHMENAYNHVENALYACQTDLSAATAARTIAERERNEALELMAEMRTIREDAIEQMKEATAARDEAREALKHWLRVWEETDCEHDDVMPAVDETRKVLSTPSPQDQRTSDPLSAAEQGNEQSGHDFLMSISGVRAKPKAAPAVRSDGEIVNWIGKRGTIAVTRTGTGGHMVILGKLKYEGVSFRHAVTAAMSPVTGEPKH